jgi:hypothetical protein
MGDSDSRAGRRAFRKTLPELAYCGSTQRAPAFLGPSSCLSYGTGTPKSTHGTRSCSHIVPGAGVLAEMR